MNHRHGIMLCLFSAILICGCSSQKANVNSIAQANQANSASHESVDNASAQNVKKKPIPPKAPILKKDLPVRTNISLADAPMIGNKNAPVTIVEFTDFQCPFCSIASDTLKLLMADNPDKIRIVFKHNPLSMHEQAQLAHQAAEAAGMQGKFWEYQAEVFADQEHMERGDLIQKAKNLGLNIAKFEADMDGNKAAEKVKKDIEEGKNAKVFAAPIFFINGSRFAGAKPLKSFQMAVNREFENTLLYSGLAGDELYQAVIHDNKASEPLPVIIKTEGDPFCGNENAPVTVIVFGDFESPFTAGAKRYIHTLCSDAAYKDKVKVVFKQMPLEIHPRAQKAAEAALAAHSQGKFWQMHDMLLDNQTKLEMTDFKKYASKIGIDPELLEQELNSGKYKEIIKDSQNEAENANIEGSPAFVINGKTVIGLQPFEVIKDKIDEAFRALK